MKQVGTITVVRAPGYPQLTYSDQEPSIEDEYVVATDQIAAMPAMASVFDDAAYPFMVGLACVLRTKKITPKSGGTLWTVHLSYKLPDEANVGNDTSEVSNEIEMDTEDIEVPLAQHTDYLLNWDHLLLVKSSDTQEAAPDWWATAKTKELTSEESKKYKMIKADADVPDGWRVIGKQDADMVGTTHYLAGVTVVTSTKRSRNKALLQEDASKDYTIQTPPDTCGKSGSWLRTGTKMSKEGRRWAARVAFKNAAKINTKLYKDSNGQTNSAS